MHEPEPSPFPSPPAKASWFLSLGAKLRSLVIAALCAGGCAVCGAVAYLVIACNPSLFELLSIGTGSAVGSLFAMPFLMFGIMQKPLLPGAAVAFATPLLWIALARITWGRDHPALLVAIPVFALTCGVLRFAMPSVWPRHLPWVCQNCNYDLRGVTTQKCPECGRPFEGTHVLPAAQNSTDASAESRFVRSAPPR